MALTLSRYLFLLLVFSLPLVRPFNTNIYGYLVPYTDLVFVAVFILFAIALIRGETKFQFDRLFVFVGLYALSLTLSATFSVDLYASLKKLIGEYYLFALCLVTLNLVRDVRFLRQTVFAWLAGSAITILASLVGFILFYLGAKTQETNYLLSHFGSLPAGNYPRIHALFANANMLCNFLNVSIVFALLAEKMGWVRPIVARVLAAAILFAALFSISPGLGGIALSCGIWFWVIARSREDGKLIGKAVLSASVLVAVFVLGATLVSPDTDNTTQLIKLPGIEKKLEPSVRVLVWQQVVERTKEFPLLGRGTGMNAADLRYETLSGDKQILTDAHNMWLNVMAQAGIVGLAAFIAFCVYVWKRFNFSNYRPFVLAVSCALVGAFFYQGLAGSFEDARHIWILIGLLAAVSVKNFSGQENDISPVSTTP